MLTQFTIRETKVPPGLKLLEIKETDLVHRDTCVVCSAPFHEVLKLKTEKGSTYFGRGYCTRCGYCGTSTAFSDAWVENYYKSQWTNTEQQLKDEMKDVRVNEVTLRFMSKYLPDKKAKILDAGAGYGRGLRGLVLGGYTGIEALELSERRVGVLKAKYPTVPVESIAIEDLQQAKILSKQFDGIFLWHVFEHLSKLNECLEAMHKATKPGGYLFISIPHFPDEHFANLLNLYVHVHSFQEPTLKFLLSRYGYTFVEGQMNADGDGIRHMYQKTGPINPKGDVSLLQSEQKNRDVYHDKVFRDFQLMYLAHQPKWTHKNVLLAFHYNASFAGSQLHRHPLPMKDAILYSSWVRASNAWLTKKTIVNKVKRKIIHQFAKQLAIPDGSMLFDRIEGIPENPRPYRTLYNTDDLMMLEFFHRGDTLKLWLE